MSLAEAFLKEVQGFLQETGMKKTTFGKRAVADPKFVFDLEAGREPKAGTIDSVRGFIRGERESKDAAA